jgi:hypothetical protein
MSTYRLDRLFAKSNLRSTNILPSLRRAWFGSVLSPIPAPDRAGSALDYRFD